MTQTSFKELGTFLNAFQQHWFEKMRIADYGGTDSICGNDVKKLLASGKLNNYNMLDYDSGIDLLKPIKGKKYDMGICMDLLEHVSNPFLVAKNIINSLNKGAYLFVTAPFVWPVHQFPNDYWRFYPEGIAELFKDMEKIDLYYKLDVEGIKEPENKQIPMSGPYSRIIGIFKKITK